MTLIDTHVDRSDLAWILSSTPFLRGCILGSIHIPLYLDQSLPLVLSWMILRNVLHERLSGSKCATWALWKTQSSRQHKQKRFKSSSNTMKINRSCCTWCQIPLFLQRGGPVQFPGHSVDNSLIGVLERLCSNIQTMVIEYSADYILRITIDYWLDFMYGVLRTP